MTTQIFATILDPTLLANFKATGQALGAALAATMTRVTTSADIDWNTVVAPTAVGSYRGFEVYHVNDSLHATHPLYLKFEYGTSNQSSNSYGLRLTIAKAVDGAGTMSSIVFGPTEICGAAFNVTPANSYATNGANSGLGLVIAPSISSGGSVLLLERARDAVGNIIGDAFYVGYKTTFGGSWTNRFYDYTLGTYNNIAGGIGCVPLNLSSDISLANATITPYFPVACISPGGTYWIPRMVLVGARADCALASVITSLFDSANFIGLGAAGQNYDQRGSAYSSIMLRWD